MALVRSIFLGIFLSVAASTALAQTQALKSFAYASASCSDGLFYFNGNFELNSGNTPGSGQFPIGNFYLRRVALTVIGGSSNDWAVVGHSGSNGDWVSGAVIGGHDSIITYDQDAAPLFTAGEYFDVHASCGSGQWVFVAFWYVPAP